MERQDRNIQFKQLIDDMDKIISTKNFQQIQKSLASIEDFEDIFLENYNRRKKEGVYYTDSHISRFISSEALIFFINKSFNRQGTDSICLRTLNDIYSLSTEDKHHVSETLYSVTICDPACGSGRFLLSSTDIIFHILEKLNPEVQKSEIKLSLIRNLFGYDISESAINLSILKLLKWSLEDKNTDISLIYSQLKSNFKAINSLMKSDLGKYNILLGNPPYGNILNSNEKNILKKENIFYNDVYCSFLLKSLNWGKEIIGFLVPKSFLLRQGYIEFRKQFLMKANILKIIDIGSKLFKNATNEVQILFYENKDNDQLRDLKIYDFPESKIISYKNQEVDSLKICFNNGCPLNLKSKNFFVYTYKNECPYCGSRTVFLNRIRIKPNPKVFEILNKIEMTGDLNYLNPISFPNMIRGEEDRGLKLVRSKIKDNSRGSCSYITARDDFSYFQIKKHRSLNIEEIDGRLLKGNNYEYYLSPKLLIKHNNIIPEAVYTEDNVCFTSSIYSLLHSDLVELKFLCSILNSILIQFYCIYAINNQKNTTVNLNQYMIRHIPIVKVDDQTKKDFAKKVDDIISFLAEENDIYDEEVKGLLKWFDNSILNLYSITEDEKKMIISDVKARIKHFGRIYA
ncbi:MAG: Eco57I restriction-modification methylase domain-containing protein [Promethearchaeota archaeon]|jgi:hypothetical protein